MTWQESDVSRNAKRTRVSKSIMGDASVTCRVGVVGRAKLWFLLSFKEEQLVATVQCIKIGGLILAPKDIQGITLKNGIVTISSCGGSTVRFIAYNPILPSVPSSIQSRLLVGFLKAICNSKFQQAEVCAKTVKRFRYMSHLSIIGAVSVIAVQIFLTSRHIESLVTIGYATIALCCFILSAPSLYLRLFERRLTGAAMK